LTQCIFTIKKKLPRGNDAASLDILFPVFLREQCGLIFLDAATVEDPTTVALKLKDLNAQRCYVTSKN